MTDAVLIDLAVKVEPSIEVVFIDTRYHFPETLETVETVRRHYGLNLRVLTVPPQPVRAVAGRPRQLLLRCQGGPARARAGRQAGLDERAAPQRGSDPGQASPIVRRDLRGLVKVNPLANWTDDDIGGYIADHDVPVNPLLAKGYPSIGCWPCTRPVTDGERPPCRPLVGPATRRSAACTSEASGSLGHDAPPVSIGRR